jgi:hypothetical protein
MSKTEKNKSGKKRALWDFGNVVKEVTFIPSDLIKRV